MSSKQHHKKTIKPSILDLPPQGMKKKDFIESFKKYYIHLLGRDENCGLPYYAFEALTLTLNERLMDRWKTTHRTYKNANCKRAFYLSMEYLLGRSLNNAMLNLGVTEEITDALNELGIDINDVIDAEPDAGLGNGGLGRLAACFMESAATLQLPVIGYGLRYEYGMFTQNIINGEQVEKPDHWLRHGHAWEIERLEYSHRIKFCGRVETYTDNQGRHKVRWLDTHDVLAIPFDVPVPGFQNDTVNTLRLWKSVATEEFDLDEFNSGDYAEAVAEKISAENITMVLYPNDANENGKALRLRQQYFLISASLQDVLAHWVKHNGNEFSNFTDKNCFQLNDTHPSLAVAELMRLLLDVYGLEWEQGWTITCKVIAYTNHTLLPEALEKWPVSLMQKQLPRLMQIIFEINARLLFEVSKRWPMDLERTRRMSIIEEGEVQQVRMANLALSGSFSVNGVAELHSQLLKTNLFKDFYELWPHKFNNKTNGVTPRRWIAACNPILADLISETIGTGWLTDLSQLQKLEPFAEDQEFRQLWQKVKHFSKEKLIEYKRKDGHLSLTTEALFDVQVKRIHEYKRQVLKILHVIYLYNRIKKGDSKDWVNRCVLIGGKAAPGYRRAKNIIKLINNVANVINSDPDTDGKLTLLFLPDYSVSAMEKICPGADLSEQISTAGKEASGTGNMKLMMNGAVTIGTYDGANIEILNEVGEENFFLFGLTHEQIEKLKPEYNPLAFIEQDEDLADVFRLLECGFFNQLEYGIFDELLNSLKSPNDPWMTVADFRNYIDAQNRVEEAYKDKDKWTKMSIINCARSGKFSTDRTIYEYNRDIWKLSAQPIKFK